MLDSSSNVNFIFSADSLRHSAVKDYSLSDNDLRRSTKSTFPANFTTDSFPSDGIANLSTTPEISSTHTLLDEEKQTNIPIPSNPPTLFLFIDTLYTKFDKQNPAFAEKGFHEWLPYMQIEYHRFCCKKLVTSWISGLGCASSGILSTKESSTLFSKGTEFVSTKLSALLLQLYRDAPGSLWRTIEQKKIVYFSQIFSFFYLFCVSCIVSIFESMLEKRTYYLLFLKSFSEYLIADSVIQRFQLDFSALFDRILEQRQARIKSLVAQSLLSFKKNHHYFSKTDKTLHLLNEYYMLAIEGSSKHPFNSIPNIDAWRPSSKDLLELVESFSPNTSYLIKEKKWVSWIRLITVPMVTAALVVFSRLIKNGMFGKRIL